MGQTVGKAVNTICGSDSDRQEKDRLMEDFLRAQFTAIQGKAEKHATQIEQLLRIAGSSEDNTLSVPISNVFTKTVIARVSVDTNEAELKGTITEAIRNFTQGHITEGVNTLVERTIDTFFHTFHGSIAQDSHYHVVMVGRSLERVDMFMYTEAIKTLNRKVSCNIVIVFRSPVDLAKLSLSSFINAYQYQVNSKAKYSNFIVQCTFYLELIKLSSSIDNWDGANNSETAVSYTERLNILERLSDLSNKIKDFEDTYSAQTLAQIEKKNTTEGRN